MTYNSIKTAIKECTTKLLSTIFMDLPNTDSILYQPDNN